jgi:Phage integrase, N-terminal SAM-like domain
LIVVQCPPLSKKALFSCPENEVHHRNTVESNLAPKTFERYKELVDLNINPKLGTIRMAQLQPVQLAEFYTWAGTEGNRRTKSGLSTRTVLHIHRLLRRALKQAVLWQLRPTNPADAVQAPRPPDIEMKPVEEERAGELILSAEGTDMFPAHPDSTLYWDAARRDSCYALERS